MNRTKEGRPIAVNLGYEERAGTKRVDNGIVATDT